MLMSAFSLLAIRQDLSVEGFLPETETNFRRDKHNYDYQCIKAIQLLPYDCRSSLLAGPSETLI